ncbi:MAG: RNA chaperone Hfq [Clostridia bacterium]|nr:RNA chaperone Hfq [Clostridia bacterium]
MMRDRHLLQEFLVEMYKRDKEVKLIIKNGYQMTGRIVAWDDELIIVAEAHRREFVFLSAISTIEECS